MTAVDLQALDVIGYDLIAQPFKAGDFNRDSHVNAADIQAMSAALTNLPSYEISNGLTDSQLIQIGDLNGDSAVTNADLQKLLKNLRNGGGSLDAVPEPAIGAGSVGLCLRCGTPQQGPFQLTPASNSNARLREI